MNAVQIRTIEIRKITAGTVYKLVSVGMLFAALPVGLPMGIMGAFGYDVILLNGEYVYGITAFITAPVLACLMSQVFTLFFGTFICLGLWIYSRIKRMNIRIVEDSNT